MRPDRRPLNKDLTGKTDMLYSDHPVGTGRPKQGKEARTMTTKHASHTPGPWRAIGREIWVGDEMLCRAEVDSPTSASYQSEGDELLANAALIAASPDLLAALKMFVAWDEDSHGTAPAAQHDAAMKAAKAAVKRATEM